MKKILLIILIVGLLALSACSKVNHSTNGLFCKTESKDGTFCLDDLAKFPDVIGDYTLTDYSPMNWEKQCREQYETVGDFCIISNDFVYYNDEGSMISITPRYIEGDVDGLNDLTLKKYALEEVERGVFRLHEESELMWFPFAEIDQFITGTYTYQEIEPGNTEFTQVDADATNEVLQYFIKLYAPSNKEYELSN